MTKTKRQWLALIKEQQSSGMSIAAFARHKGISVNNFYARRHDFRQEGVIEADSTFIKVTQQKTVTTHIASQSIELQIGHAQLRIPCTVEPQWVAQLLGELRT